MANAWIPKHGVTPGQAAFAAIIRPEDVSSPYKIPAWEGVRTKRYKYAKYVDQQPAFEFLHDLKTDPDQLSNLTDNSARADVLNQMRQRCDELRDQYGGKYSPAAFPTVRR